MPALAHAGDHDAPGNVKHALHDLDKVVVQALRQRRNGLGLDREGRRRQAQNLRRFNGALGL